MIVKLCAMWFVLLSVLPFTAPFSTIEPADFISGHSPDAEIVLTTQAFPIIADDLVMVSDRSDFAVQSRWCGVVTIASYEAVPARPLFLSPVASPTLTANLPPASAVLQI